MVARKKLTRLARIGISHSDRAKVLAGKGLYSEALSELRVALFSLRSENSDGRLNDEIAGVLHSIGSVNLLLGKYEDAKTAFTDAVAIRRPMSNNPEIAGSLIGLADSCRGLCEFERSEELLQDALQVALGQKNDALASRIIGMLDMIERTRDHLPAGDVADVNDYYVPSEYAALQAVLRNVELVITPTGIKLGLTLGFPGLEYSLLSGCRDKSPGLGILFPGELCAIRSLAVVDDGETETESSCVPFDGTLFAPGSYHKHGPLPVPLCKKFTFTTGKGALIKWVLSPNGWYKATLDIEVPAIRDGFRIMLALPYYLRFHHVTIDVKKPLEYGQLTIDEGTYHVTKNPDRVKPGPNLPYAFKRRLFYGSAFGVMDIPADSTLKYGVISFEFVK